MNLTVSSHAIKRAVERFNVSQTKAAEWIRNQLSRAMFISTTIDKYGKPGRLYARGQIGIILHESSDLVVTVMQYTKPTPDVRDKVCIYLTKELRKLERKESSLSRKTRITIAEMTVERSRIVLKRERARSVATINACQALINGIDLHITQLNAELRALRLEKKNVAKSLAVYSA
ncbi:hypothetical protein GOP56_11285 [Brevibacillus sp. 7WMA2]|uniref:hypothetical protein n=1 Tax=Brevibacillus sp. 7WMA2 TaxID=2683193 RepID=UPI0013A7644B|nr:hypothetical protein [Brevibacillus sp. 7WMA2]QIC06139.1 hypothetical protein GOP56_11285 [Brevibacillus sp. 7WMA2]